MTSGIFTSQTAAEVSACQELMNELSSAVSGRPDELIPILQTVQQKLGYLPEAALLEIARMTGLPTATVFGVATFYEQFRFHPAGRHTIRVCRGTACHVRGSDQILSEIENRYHLAPGETSNDRLFTLETVACFGSCALAPVVLVDNSVKGRMNLSETRKTLEKLEEKANGPQTNPL